MAEIVAVCRSRHRGTRKDPVASVVLEECQGVAGDAHADSGTHRQVSLLAEESVQQMAEAGLVVGPGDFAENITTRGISLVSLPKGTRLAIGEGAVLEVSQVGKECHTPCAIFHQVGWCVMPREGVFARVVSGGLVRPGDGIRIERQHDHA
jgi:MOSC domain-containing protein YiiM